MSRAESYDAWYDAALGSFCLRREIELVRRGGAFDQAEKALDVGCGTGRFLLSLASESEMAVGVDRDREMLALASRRTPDTLGGRVVWLQADATTLPFAAESFDVVFEVTAMCFCNAPKRAIAEMCRVCRPGGRIILGDLNPYSPWQWWRRVRHAFGIGLSRGARWHPPDEFSRTLQENGCRVLRSERALFLPPLNVPDIIGWHEACEAVGSLLWPWAGAFYVVEAEKVR